MEQKKLEMVEQKVTLDAYGYKVHLTISLTEHGDFDILVKDASEKAIARAFWEQLGKYEEKKDVGNG